jgi:tetratricopeptide (TPR) repeat protein
MKPYVLLVYLFFLFIKLNAQNIDSLLQVTRKTNNDSLKIENYIKMKEKLLLTDVDSALFFIKKAIKIAKKKDDDFLIAKSLIHYGILWKIKKEYKKSEEQYLKSLSIIEEHNYNNLHENVLNSLGVLYTDMFKDEKALKYFYKSVDIAKKNKNKRMLISVTNNIARILYRQGKYSESLKSFKNCLRESESINDYKSLKASLLNISAVYNIQKKQDSALVYIRKAIKLLKKKNDQRALATAYNNLGNIYYKLKDYQSTLKYYTKSQDLYQKLNTNNFTLYRNIAILYQEKLKNNNLAEKYYKLAEMQALSENAENINVVEVYEQLANIYYETNKHEKSYQYFLKRIQLSDKIFKEKKEKRIA